MTANRISKTSRKVKRGRRLLWAASVIVALQVTTSYSIKSPCASPDPNSASRRINLLCYNSRRIIETTQSRQERPMTTYVDILREENAPVIGIDELGIVQHVNASFEREYGWTKTDLAGQSIT